MDMWTPCLTIIHRHGWGTPSRLCRLLWPNSRPIHCSPRSPRCARSRGIRKSALTFEEYEAILAMMLAKGQDLRWIATNSVDGGSSRGRTFARDVEVHLIEPLLLRLGYSDRDWIRQMLRKWGEENATTQTMPSERWQCVARKVHE